MTLNELVQRVKRRLTMMNPAWAYGELEIMAAIPTGIQRLSVKVMRDPNMDVLLRQNYSVTLDASGVGNLLTATGAITGLAGEILFEGIPFDSVLDGDSNVLVYIPHYQDFLRPQPTVFGYYCTERERILTRAINTSVNGPLDIVGAPGPLTVTASFAPTNVTDVATELTDNLIDEVVGVVTAMPVMEAQAA